MPVDPVRDAAIDVLLRVFEHDAYLTISLDKTLRRKGGALSERGRRFLTQLVYGTVRHKILCEYVLSSLVHQSLEDLPAPIAAILRMGVFQSLFCHQVTPPAMVHTSVDLAKRKGHAGTARLVNAVLRKVPHSIDDVAFPDKESSSLEYLSRRYSLSPWIVERWVNEFGMPGAEELCEATDSEAPKSLRVNLLKTTKDALAAYLVKKKAVADTDGAVPEALTVVEGGIPFRGKPFQNGHFYVQDEASMLPPHLLEPQAGERILDLCAAPGGKTTHLAELCGDRALVVALDSHPGKLGLVRENTERLGLEGIRPVGGDGVHPPFDTVFDKVLVDAPCTGLGTLRRHPEIKWRCKAEDPAKLAKTQQALLRSGLQLCKNGGLVVYSVCTFTPEETNEVVDAILGDTDVAPEDGPPWLNQWKIAPGRYRVLPKKGRSDGYFLIRLRKAS